MVEGVITRELVQAMLPRVGAGVGGGVPTGSLRFVERRGAGDVLSPLYLLRGQVPR
jgi:hypothetical protein